MSEVRVVKRYPKRTRPEQPPLPEAQPVTQRNIRLVAIGASTGGPPAIQKVLKNLVKPFPATVLIVQHISAGFIEGLATWLSATTGMPVRVAKPGEIAQAGTAYIAPDGSQMGVDGDFRILCSQQPAEHGMRPSVSCLFRSVAKSHGAQAAGILLTGMGRDGAEDLNEMRKQGAITFAQDQESSVVHGMPGEAIRIGAAMHVGTPERISLLLSALISVEERANSAPTP